MQHERKAEILNAFMKLVSKYGFDKTTMQDIAREANISIGVIYKDYANKEDLIEAYIGYLNKQFSTDCEKIVDRSLPPEKQLHDLIVGYITLIHRYKTNDLGFLQLISSDSFIKYIRKPLQHRADFEVTLVTIVEEIIQTGMEQGCFAVENISEAAYFIRSAFDSSLLKLILLNQSFEDTIASVDRIYPFLLKALK